MSLPHRTDAEGYDLAVWENPDLWPPETNSDAHAWPAWTDADRWEINHDAPEPGDDGIPDAPDCGPGYGAQCHALETAGVARVSGGAPEPFEPSEADWQDYREWTEAVERLDDLRREEDSRHPVYGYE